MRIPGVFSAAAAVLFMAATAAGQVVCRNGVCVQVCPPPVAYGQVVYGPVVTPVQQPIEEMPPVENVATEADGPHVRCIINGSCGSGTICGADARGSYVVTNAHVVGTAIGRVVAIDLIANGRAVRVQGRTIMAGYSNSRMVDFAIVFVESLTSKRYMPMLKTEPEGQPFQTTGAPRCVWPLVTKDFQQPRNYGDGLITGVPNAIGGQSGSAIYNAAGQQIALLTWSIGGRCAGQKTSKLWAVATQRNVLLADPRPDGLQEVGDQGRRPVTQEGIFGQAALFAGDGEMGAAPAESSYVRPQTENTISNVVGTQMEDLPIWYEPGKPDPIPDPTPDDPAPSDPPADPDCMKVTDAERKLIEFIRATAAEDEAGIGDRRPRDRAVDWLKLFQLVMQIIQLIQQGRV